MNLYAIYTKEQELLKEIFVKSMKDNWKLNIICWPSPGSNVQNWGTPEFVQLMRRRYEYLVEMIKKEMGNVIIWSDIDIQFFSACTSAIEKALANHDLVFQSEHWPKKDVNIGFIAIRCNPKTLALFESMLKIKLEDLKYYDQSAINMVLKNEKVDISWDVLPYQFWAKSHGGFPPKGILLHHANTTFPTVRNGQKVSCTDLKLEQLADVKEFVSSYPLWKWYLWGKWRLLGKALIN